MRGPERVPSWPLTCPLFLSPSRLLETEVLLRVKDISHFLMQDIAFLSGKQTLSYVETR